VVWPAYGQTTVGVRSGEPTVIDLARLHEPGTRALLARAVLMVDAADGEKSTTAGPRSTAQAPVDHAVTAAPVDTAMAPGEHPTPTRQDEPAHLRTDLSRRLTWMREVIENAGKV
jgi:hypothetical protein